MTFVPDWDWLVVDLEWDPEDEDRLLAIGVSDGVTSSSWTLEDLPPEILLVLDSPDVVKVEHSTADATKLHQNGISLRGDIHDSMVACWCLNEDQSLRLEDLILKRLKYDPDKRLKRSAKKVLFRCDDGAWVPIGRAPLRQLLDYNRRDIIGTAKLYLAAMADLEEAGRLQFYLDEMVPFTQVLIDMELQGMPINIEQCESLRDEVEIRTETARVELMRAAGLPTSFNLGSGDQMAAYLYGKGELDIKDHLLVGDEIPEGFTVDKVARKYVWGHWTVKCRGLSTRGIPKTKSGARHKVDTKSLLTKLDDEWCRELIVWRKDEKLLSTYLRRFPEIAVEVGPPGDEASKGSDERVGATAPPATPPAPGAPASTRIYGRFKQTGTKTGRLSSAEPNLQNIPSVGEMGKKVRDLFQGLLIVGDYSQLEPRLMAHYSGDPVLMDIFTNGKDIYLEVAHAVWGEWVEKEDPRRGISKVTYLGSQYGAGGDTLATMLALNGYPTTPAVAAEYQDAMRGRFKVLERWKEYEIKQAHSLGYVETIGGWRRRIGALHYGDYEEVRRGERQAVNAKIQGSAADIMRRVMVRWYRSGLSHSIPLIGQVHDELIWEVLVKAWYGDPQLLHTLQVLGERGHGFDLDVPLVFEPSYGHSWASAKDGEADVIDLPDEEEAA